MGWEPYVEYSNNATDFLYVQSGFAVSEDVGDFEFAQKVGAQWMRITLTNGAGTVSVTRNPWSIPLNLSARYTGLKPFTFSAWFEKAFFLMQMSGNGASRLSSLVANSSSSISQLTSLTDYAFGARVGVKFSPLSIAADYSRTTVILVGTSTHVIDTEVTVTAVPRWEFSAGTGLFLAEGSPATVTFKLGTAFLF